MRQGRLLAENSPEELLAQYNMETLEEVFLKLCMTDSSSRADQIASGDNLSINNKYNQESMEEGGIVNPALDLDNELNLNNNVIIKNNKSQLANVLSVYSQGTNYSLNVNESKSPSSI